MAAGDDDGWARRRRFVSANGAPILGLLGRPRRGMLGDITGGRRLTVRLYTVLGWLALFIRPSPRLVSQTFTAAAARRGCFCASLRAQDVNAIAGWNAGWLGSGTASLGE